MHDSNHEPEIILDQNGLYQNSSKTLDKKERYVLYYVQEKLQERG